MGGSERDAPGFGLSGNHRQFPGIPSSRLRKYALSVEIVITVREGGCSVDMQRGSENHRAPKA